MFIVYNLNWIKEEPPEDEETMWDQQNEWVFFAHTGKERILNKKYLIITK
jgi:hypothetical protein